MYDIPCVIFAGGKSSRMGEDKALLPFGDYPTLTEYQYARLSKIFTHVYISAKEKEKFNFSANFILDARKGQALYAPTEGFIAAFEQLKSERIFVISVDAPFINKTEIKKILSQDQKVYDATIAKTQQGAEPLCGVYHNSLLKSFKNMRTKNSHKLGLLLQNSHTHYVSFENNKAFLNLNKPHEYEEALLLLNS